MRNTTASFCAVLTAAAALTAAAPAFAVPVASAGYQVSLFAAPGTNKNADDIEVAGNHLFVAYSNGAASDGTSGSSNIVEYNFAGTALNSFTVAGKVESLRLNPANGLLYTNENEDGNSTLVTINLSTNAQTTYTFSTFPHGGGYDDMRIINGTVYVVGSSPASPSPSGPPPFNAGSNAIYSVTLNGTHADVTGVLSNTATATDIVSGTPITLNLTDPDSMTTTPNGHLLLTDQTNGQLIDVANPGTVAQAVRSLLLVNNITGGSITTDDTNFATGTGGEILFSDKTTDNIYAIRALNGFTLNSAFSSDKAGSIDSLNQTTGAETPIVTGVSSAGLAYADIIPEPSTLALLSLAAVALIKRRK